MSKETAIFSVISFNIADGLSTNIPELQHVLWREKEKRPKVLFMSYPEAFKPGMVDKKTVNRFSRYFGHEGFVITPYKTADKRPDDHVLLTTYDATALEHRISSTRVRLATRNATKFDVKHPRVGGKLTAIFGHLDDRSEASRVMQARALMGIIKPEDKTILGFDFNAMYETSAGAQITRFIGHALAGMRPESTDPNPVTGKRSRTAQLFALSDMAIGTTMTELSESGFKDADESRYPGGTLKIAPGPFGIGIDKLLHNAGITVIDVGTFRGPSDHRGIVATFEVDQVAA